jgi:mRNA interferase YafQ
MYSIKATNQFKKDLKRCKKRGYDLSLLELVIDLLQKTGKVPEKYRPHKLSGDYENCWECHIKSDWLLVWMQNDTELILLFIATGSHSDLF